MEIFKVWILILLTGLLLPFSQCSEKKQKLEFNGHQSGLYYIDNDEPVDKKISGVVYMFQKITKKSAIHAIFHYEYSVYAANITKNMLEEAINEFSPPIWKMAEPQVKVNWKALLEEELIAIEESLMKSRIVGSQASSKTSAIVVIVDENTVTQAQIGNSRILTFANDPQQSKTQLRAQEIKPKDPNNILGGKYFKTKNARIRGDTALVTELSDVKFIVMGTEHLRNVGDDEIAKTISANSNDLKKAAQNIAKSLNTPKGEESNAVIVIGLNPLVPIVVPKKTGPTPSYRDARNAKKQPGFIRRLSQYL